MARALPFFTLALAAPQPNIVYLVIDDVRPFGSAPATPNTPNTPNTHPPHPTPAMRPPAHPTQWGWANFAPHRPAGQAGNAEFPTPNLAALAAEGITFDRLYAVRFNRLAEPDARAPPARGVLSPRQPARRRPCSTSSAAPAARRFKRAACPST